MKKNRFTKDSFKKVFNITKELNPDDFEDGEVDFQAVIEQKDDYNPDDIDVELVERNKGLKKKK